MTTVLVVNLDIAGTDRRARPSLSGIKARGLQRQTCRLCPPTRRRAQIAARVKDVLDFMAAVSWLLACLIDR
jgi:hypothetical protein